MYKELKIMGTYVNGKTFVVAWITWNDYILHQELITALNNMHALELSSQNLIELDDIHNFPTMSELEEIAFDSDGMISVIEVPNNGNV
jgi:hypothetical protein